MKSKDNLIQTLTSSKSCPSTSPPKNGGFAQDDETINKNRDTLVACPCFYFEPCTIFTRIHFQKCAYIMMTSIEFGGSNDNPTTSFTTFTQESYSSRCMRRTGRVLRHQFLLVSPGFSDRADPGRCAGHPCLPGNHGNRAERIDMESGWRIQIAEVGLISAIVLLPVIYHSSAIITEPAHGYTFLR